MDKNLEEQKENINQENVANNLIEEEANKAAEEIANRLPEDDDEKSSTKYAVKKGIGIALGGILGVVLLALVGLLVCGFQFYYVLTSSMSPTIYAGETVLVNTNVDKNNLKVGDIVTFSAGGNTVTHRILEVKEEGGKVTYLQGPDLNYRKDVLKEEINIPTSSEAPYVISAENVKGVVVTINDKPVKLVILGAVFKTFKSPSALGFAKTAIIVVIIGLVLWTIISSIIERKRK